MILGFILYIIYSVAIAAIGNKLFYYDADFAVFYTIFSLIGGVVLLINL